MKEHFALSRRALFGGMLLLAPGLAVAQGAPMTDRKLLFILLRGGWDGLQVVMPVGDPAYAPARGALAVPREVDGAALKLDGMFALHPALKEGAGLWEAGQLLPVHAVASPYRERSHFDAQQVLESGGTAPHRLDSGWLNRLLPLLGPGAPAMAIAPTVPLALRGPAAVGSHAPSVLPNAPDDLKARVAAMYARDPLLHGLWSQAVAAEMRAGMDAAGRANPVRLAEMAATFMVGPQGARVAMLAHDGWDTHANQAGRLVNQLGQLDRMLAALRTGLGAEWANTLVVVASEFGRTVKVNGTGGTDHGTGGLMLLTGGSAKGGRVLADWPGLSAGALLEARDVQPTIDMRSILAGAAAAQFGLDPEQAARAMFPGGGVRAADGLVRV